MAKQFLVVCILFFAPFIANCQAIDTANPDSLQLISKNYHVKIDRALHQHFFLQSTKQPIVNASSIIATRDSSVLFYVLLLLAFILSFFKYVYERYFNTLFRVFFNTTLRQSQLTDQLLQSKLTSLLFNIFFVITGGLYVYFILNHFKWNTSQAQWQKIMYCIIGLAAIYATKFITLTFTGWLTGKSTMVDTYVFVIFLINKIIGIILLPIVIVMAFAPESIKAPIAIISLLFIALMLLLRYFRAYGLTQNNLKISRFHFTLYIVGVEILPLLVMYKSLLLFVQ
jgi:uncharacterized membrane protein YuzA (DUF378 family)